MSVLSSKPIISELKNINIAIELLELGARTQVLEAVTQLTKSRASKLYREVTGESPPKGQLPFSADWFLSWRPNIHASLFYLIYKRYTARLHDAESLAKAYRRYKEILDDSDSSPEFTITRAWTLVRFIESEVLAERPCSECGVPFIAHAQDLPDDYRCAICNPPSRAGRTYKAPTEGVMVNRKQAG